MSRPRGATPLKTTVGTLRAFLQCISVRFTCYYYLAFYCGLASTGTVGFDWLCFSALYWFVHSGTTELLNRLADRASDEVNRPERTYLCQQVGYTRLRVAAIIGCVLLALLGVVWIVMVPSPTVVVLVLVADFLCVNYSYGLRLGRSRFLSLLVLAFPFVGTFAGGWALSHPGLDAATGAAFVQDALPVLLIGGLGLGSLSGVKDLTDVLGDRLKGYRSGWLWLVQSRAALVGVALATLPFAVLVGCVAADLLAVRYLVLLVLLVPALMLANGSRRARGPVEKMAVREFFYHYWLVFQGALTILYVGTFQSAIVVAVCFVCWRLATRYLHWADDSGLKWLSAVWRVNTRWPDQAPPIVMAAEKAASRGD